MTPSPQYYIDLAALDDEQRAAVDAPGNVVVLAGPGSGKTRTLVLRAGRRLLEIPEAQGVACLTYTRFAAREIETRLRILRIANGDRAICSTVHSFCLREIIRPYAPLLGFQEYESLTVLGDVDYESLLQKCMDQVGLAQKPAWIKFSVQIIRRARASGDTVDEFDAREVEVADLVDETMRRSGSLDFEAMVSIALKILRTSSTVLDLVAARFPIVVVDEYQDMGGVLHTLIEELQARGQVEIFAVGDVDQSIFTFAGADATWLLQLADRRDFEVAILKNNYRSGSDLIRAAEAALGAFKQRSIAREELPGRVIVRTAHGSLATHAEIVAEHVVSLAESGVDWSEIAVFYPQKGPLPTLLMQCFNDACIPVHWEKEALELPDCDVARLVVGIVEAVLLRAPRQDSSVPNNRLLDDSSIHLSRILGRLRKASVLAPLKLRFDALRGIERIFTGQLPSRPEDMFGPWLANIDLALELQTIAERLDGQNVDAFQKLKDLASLQSTQLQDVAPDSEAIHRIRLTTYHGAKGREFGHVVMPGLVNGVMPPDQPVRGKWGPPTGKKLDEARRLFYVGLTRAKESVLLVDGRTVDKPWGPAPSTSSILLQEMLLRLDGGE